MFLFYVLSFFKKGDTIQGGTLFKEIRYFHSIKSGLQIANSTHMNFKLRLVFKKEIFLLLFDVVVYYAIST